MTVRCGNLRVSNIAELTHFHEWKTQQKRKGTMDVCAIRTKAFFILFCCLCCAEAVSSSR